MLSPIHYSRCNNVEALFVQLFYQRARYPRLRKSHQRRCVVVDVSRARNISSWKKREIATFIVPKKNTRKKTQRALSYLSVGRSVCGDRAHSREESVWCGGNVMWWKTQQAKEMERRATEEPESVVNTRIYTIFISPKMESFSRHYQWPEIQVFFISFSLLFPHLSLSPSQLLHHHRDRATSSSLYSCICCPKRGFDFLLKIALASDFFLFIPPSTMLPSSRAQLWIRWGKGGRKKLDERENQNKNPREEEGRRVEMGQKKRRLDEKAAKKCFKEFKWFQSVIRRVQTGFSAELRVECALLLLFFSFRKKLAFKRLFLNEIFSLMKGKASPSTADISDNNNKSCACMQLLCAANLLKKYKS